MPGARASYPRLDVARPIRGGGAVEMMVVMPARAGQCPGSAWGTSRWGW
jgi:hypothetical protein